MTEFTYEGKVYRYIPYSDLDDDDFPKGKRKDVTKPHNPLSHHKYNPYVDLGCGFDIETSRIPNTKLSVMYVWQFSIDDVTIIGRTWDEFRELLERISEHYGLDKDKRLLVYIHNEKFEFSFMKKQLGWNMRPIKRDGCVVDIRPDIFALDRREVIKATTCEWIEFRDSLCLTLLPLEKLPKNYGLSIEKLVGDLDYSLTRHFDTPLSDQELAYCINDVQILSEFYHKYIWKEFIKQGKDIPLTITAIVRNELKEEFKKCDKAFKSKYKKLIKKCLPTTKEEYDYIIRYLFRGGYNHANLDYTNVTFANDVSEMVGLDMRSFDFKSAYPAVMVQEKFVFDYTEVDVSFFKKMMTDKKWLKENGFKGLFKIKNVATKLGHTLESKSKLVDFSDGCRFDNGRLLTTIVKDGDTVIDEGWVLVELTEIDLDNWFKIYDIDYDDVECLKLSWGKKYELPHFFKRLIFKYFYLKETIDKITNPVEYAIAKSKLNSLYGMCVSALIYGDLKMLEEDTEIDGTIYKAGEMIDGHCEQKWEDVKPLLLPQWGIQITSYVRNRLITLMSKIGNDWVYSDTDSGKIINITRNLWIIEAFNNEIIRKNKTMWCPEEYDRNLFMNIGIFDDEGRLYNFKTLGCKRYLYKALEFNKKTEKYSLVEKTVVAGMKKGSLQEYCFENDLNIFEEFTNDLLLDPTVSKKKTASYNDEPFEVELTDYLGNTKIVSEESCCTIVDIQFKIKMSQEYLRLVAENSNYKFMKGRARYV